MSVKYNDATRREILKTGTIVGAGILIGSRGVGGAFAQSETTPASWEEIVEASKSEGSVTYYMVNPDMSDGLKAGFKQAYPWLDLSIYAAPSVDGMVSKLLTEHSLGQYTADVVHSRELHLAVYRERDVIEPVTLPNDAKLPTALQDPTGYYHPMYQVPVLLAYNKNLVANPPQDDLMGLADPQWMGRVGIDSPRNKGPSWFFLASRRALWGDAVWEEWLSRFKANVRIFSTASDAYQAVVRGDVAFSISTYSDIFGAQTEGSPAVAGWYENVTTFTLGLNLIKHAPHPNAAKLFINWILSDEGQLEFSKAKRMTTVPIEGALSLAGAMPPNVELMPQSQMRPFFDDPDGFADEACNYVQC